MNDKLLVMKKLILIFFILFSIGVYGQDTTNKDLIKEVNIELGVDSWIVQGDYVYIKDDEIYQDCRWNISEVEYKLKYESWNVSWEEEQYMYILYIICKEENCIWMDEGRRTRVLMLNLEFGDDEKRANRVLELLNKLK